MGLTTVLALGSGCVSTGAAPVVPLPRFNP